MQKNRLKKNSELCFVYLTSYRHYKINYNKEERYSLVKNIVNESNSTIIDIHKYFFNKGKNSFNFFLFQLNDYYNVDRYKEVAETIYEFTLK